MPAWKIASGEFFSDQMLERIYKTKKPLLISTGMSNYKEISKLVKKLKRKKLSFFYFNVLANTLQIKKYWFKRNK